ncbi:MAG: hypothetical protein ACE5GC_00565 [Acidimicrobiia bacterium]
MPVAIFVIVVVAVVFIAVLVRIGRSDSVAASGAGPQSAPRLHLDPVDFTVRGETAVVTFDVALPEGVSDPALADVLAGQAIEVVRIKQSRGLPLQGITEVRAMGRRGGGYAVAATVGLAEPGELPPPRDPSDVEVTTGGGPDGDPLEQFLGGDPEDQPLGLPVRDSNVLPPLSDDVRLTSGVVAALGRRGTGPDSMGPGDLVLALLDMAGYAVRSLAKPGTYVATRGGSETFIRVVEHAPGSYPELSEQAVNGFLGAFYASGTDRGLLFSDKFCPHLVYEKERREPRVRFVTRERAQGFVNTMAVR